MRSKNGSATGKSNIMGLRNQKRKSARKQTNRNTVVAGATTTEALNIDDDRVSVEAENQPSAGNSVNSAEVTPAPAEPVVQPSLEEEPAGEPREAEGGEAEDDEDDGADVDTTTMYVRDRNAEVLVAELRNKAYPAPADYDEIVDISDDQMLFGRSPWFDRDAVAIGDLVDEYVQEDGRMASRRHSFGGQEDVVLVKPVLL